MKKQKTEQFSSVFRNLSPKMCLRDLLAKDAKLVRDALQAFSGGGIWSSGVPINLENLEKQTGRKFSDLLYTPGVAAPSLKLAALHLQAQKKNTSQAWEKFYQVLYELTPKGRRVAVVSDGTRVLGLGDIGPFAGQEVMYGKCLLFNLLGGLYGEPHVLTATKPEEIIRWVLNGQANWGAVNLEDIESPKCFYILEQLRKKAEIAVWHDDQQGTAAVTLAGLLNALKVVGKKIEEVKIVFLGFGAANTKTAEYLWVAGADPEKCLCLDSQGIIHLQRKDINWEEYPNKLQAAKLTKPKITDGPQQALKEADVVIGLSAPGAMTLKQVATMAKKAIVFACANPFPEIDPKEAAKLENVAIVATGRSDYPNQVNNSLGFPGIIAGTVSVASQDITDAMVIAGAYALARQVVNPQPQLILPKMTLKNMKKISPAIAEEVGKVAIKTGVARLRKKPKEIYQEVQGRIIQNQKRLLDYQA